MTQKRKEIGMGKQILAIVLIAVLVSCTDQFVEGEVAGGFSELAPKSEIGALMEKARWGNGQACLKLADCYRDGIGVKPDFVNMMSMLSMAEDFGAINRVEDYFGEIPADNELEFLAKWAKDDADSNAVLGALAVERGDTLQGIQMIQTAAEQGSSLAILLRCSTNLNTIAKPGIAKLKDASEKVPYAYKILGRIYSGEDYRGLKDEQLAAYYYLKADEYTCLDREGARWLMNYYHAGHDLNLSPKDLERIQALTGMNQGEMKKKCHADRYLEDMVTGFLFDEISKYPDINKGIILVVETKTGRIKANVSYEKEGEDYLTCSYDNESSHMTQGATYLALLSSGKVSPESVFDAGDGVYGDIKDHNWRRGGYGKINLDWAFGHCSDVAFAKAKEFVYGDNSSEYDSLMDSYLGDSTHGVMDMLTFYNAIANDGRIIKLVTDGEYGVVIREQIAQPEHIRLLQAGLRHTVSDGIFKGAGRSYTNVSAHGCTFKIADGGHRMELCGYFPSEDPLYTIMVILEKKSLPASAGGMCGEIMVQTIDTLVDYYGLKNEWIRDIDK